MKLIAALATVVLLWVASGCGPGDPRTKLLAERLDWTVEPQTWAAGESGITLSVKIQGPVHGTLEQLSFRIDMMDASGAIVESAWWTQNLAAIQRGTPTDFLIKLPPRDLGEVEIEQISVDLVPDPSPEEEKQIRELQGL